MTTELFLDFLAILMDSRKAEGMQFTINLVTPDNGEQFVIELSNSTLTNIEGYQAEDADLTLTITRLGLGQVPRYAVPEPSRQSDQPSASAEHLLRHRRKRPTAWVMNIQPVSSGAFS